MTETIACGDCGAPLQIESEDRPQPCHRCGSLKRRYGVDLSESFETHDSLKGKVIDPSKTGKRKVRSEFVVGDDLHRKTGHWNKLERDIDRENDQYHERIVEPQTGEVLREVDEPLSQHQKRGSARKSKPE